MMMMLNILNNRNMPPTTANTTSMGDHTAAFAVTANVGAVVPSPLSSSRLDRKVPFLLLGDLGMPSSGVLADKLNVDDNNKGDFETKLSSASHDDASWSSKAKSVLVVAATPSASESSALPSSQQAVVEDIRVILKNLQLGKAAADATATTAKESSSSSSEKQQQPCIHIMDKKQLSFATNVDGSVQCCIHVVDRVQDPKDVANCWYSKQEKMKMACNYFAVLQWYRSPPGDDDDDDDDDKLGGGGGGDSSATTIYHVSEYRRALLKLYQKGPPVLRPVDQQVLAFQYGNNNDADDDTNDDSADDTDDGPRGLERLILHQESGRRVKKHLRQVLKAQKRHRAAVAAAVADAPPVFLTEDEDDEATMLHEIRVASLKTSVPSQRFSQGLAQYDAASAAAV